MTTQAFAEAHAPPSAPPAPISGLSGLHPAYFGMVMATGIVSIACYLLGLILVGRILFGFNILLRN